MIKDFKIGAFSRPVSDLSDSPEISAGELKAHFDSNSYELLESLNGLIDYLSGDNALGELKISGKSLYELLEQKVSKEAGKGLSANDYTTEEKNKLASLVGFDEAKINEILSGKVDKEAGKGLSSNDYTTDEKNKLASLSNYNDSSLKQSIAGKVDKEEGKGLSSNDYTTEEKNKLASLSNYDDSDLRELIKSFSGTFAEIDYADIDDQTLPKGIYKLVNIPTNETNIIEDENNKDILYPAEEILFISDYGEYWEDEIQSGHDDGILQVRYRGDGTVLKRFCYTAGGAVSGTWGKWKSVFVQTNTIPEIDYADIDDKTLDFGIYKLINVPVYKSGEGLDEVHSSSELLFISDYGVYYEYGIDASSHEFGPLQIRYRSDGTILRRWGYENDDVWGEWSVISSQSGTNIEVTDNLTSTSTNAALSANMGRKLNEKIGDIETALDEIIALQNLYTGGDSE